MILAERQRASWSYIPAGIFVTVMVLSAPLFSQELRWWRARGTENIGIAGMDTYLRDPDTMYAIGLRDSSGTASNGVTLRSTNRGQSWDSISAEGTDVGTIQVDP